jgi:hypothetical protein
MVNVNAHLPFNLHNKHLSAIIDASSSGSRSGSSNRPSVNLPPLSLPSQSHEQIQGYVGAPLAPVGHPTTSRDSSTVGSREPSAYESEISSARTPILNIRLVKKLPSSSVNITARRGRARRKGGETIASGTGVEKESVPASTGLPSSDSTVADNFPPAAKFSLGTAENIQPELTLSLSPASTIDFVIQNTGPLTVSWGD